MNSFSKSRLIQPKLDIPSDFRYISQGERFKVGLLSNWRHFKKSWEVFSRNRLAVLGLVLLLLYASMVVIHPLLLRTVWLKSVYDPVVGIDMNIFPNPSPPSIKHPLGTDTLGRDVLSMLMAATGPSLAMALISAMTAAVIGTMIAALSAYFKGVVDDIFSHLADLIMLMPAPLVMVLIGFTLDIGPYEFGLIYGILVGVGNVAIVLRAHALTVVSRAFMEAARVAGGGSLHIITRHLVPHLLPLASVNMLLTVTGAIFANGFIAFLGLSRAHLNWGSMIYDSFVYQMLNGIIPWNVLLPSALAISLFAASFYLIALGLQDVTNPRLAEQKVVRTVIPIEAKREKASPEPIIAEPIVKGVSPITETVLKPSSSPGLKTSEATATLPTMPSDSFETYWIAVMVAKFRDDELDSGSSFSKLCSEITDDLISRGVLVSQLNDGSLVASLGLATSVPPQASALMITTFGLKIKDIVDEFNRQRDGESSNGIKLDMGISIGKVNLHPSEITNWFVPVLSAQVGLVARTLCTFASFMRHGGVLICENIYNYLTAVQHHFIFGRKGMAKLPTSDGQKMVYELVGYNSYGAGLDANEPEDFVGRT